MDLVLNVINILIYSFADPKRVFYSLNLSIFKVLCYSHCVTLSSWSLTYGFP